MITIGNIINLVCSKTGCTPEHLRGPRRARPLAWTRQYAYLLCYELCPQSSMPIIGRAFNRDHTTILYGINRAKERLRRDREIEIWFNDLVSQLRLKAPRGTIRLGERVTT